jgi:hypothetical protein
VQRVRVHGTGLQPFSFLSHNGADDDASEVHT